MAIHDGFRELLPAEKYRFPPDPQSSQGEKLGHNLNHLVDKDYRLL
jgi:hypothetical protein